MRTGILGFLATGLLPVEFPGFGGDRIASRQHRRLAPMSTRLSAGRVRTTYEFIKSHRRQFSVEAMCRVLEVAPSGYYD